MRIKNLTLTRLINSVIARRKPFRLEFGGGDQNLELADTILLPPDVHVDNVHVGVVRDAGRYAYYPKYERFLKNNSIVYDYLQLHHSSWLENAKKFDVILWRPMSSPWALEEGREKMYTLERFQHKLVYPSFDEVLFYEDKILQYYILRDAGFPIAETFVSFDYDETRAWIERADYPFVSKIRTGSASQGTILVRNKRQARRLVERIFRAGAPTYWPFLRQKNYVFFQKFIPHTGFDLRVIVIDENNILGYYRHVPKGDFRASGMGLVEFTSLPLQAVKMALRIVDYLRFTNLAVDFIQSADDKRYYVIETSNIVKVDTLANLKVNGNPGRLCYDVKRDRLIFDAGNFWLQELLLLKFFDMHYGPTGLQKIKKANSGPCSFHHPVGENQPPEYEKIASK